MNKFLILILTNAFIYQLNCQNSLEVKYNLYKSFRVLNYAKTDVKLQQKALSREIEENDAYVFELGVYKYWVLNKQLNLGLGANYSRMGYKLKELKDIRWPSEITAQGYNFDPSLPHNIVPSNFVNYIEIPIIFEYNSRSKFNFSPSISIGNQIYINSLAKSNTDLGNNSKFGKDNNVSSYNLAITGGIALGYRVNDFELRIGLSYKNQLLTTIKSDINEVLYSYGLNLGVRYLIM